MLKRLCGAVLRAAPRAAGLNRMRRRARRGATISCWSAETSSARSVRFPNANGGIRSDVGIVQHLRLLCHRKSFRYNDG